MNLSINNKFAYINKENQLSINIINLSNWTCSILIMGIKKLVNIEPKSCKKLCVNSPL